MLSIPLIARDLTEEGVVVCGVRDGRELALLGYHLHCEDEQKNPYPILLKEATAGGLGRLLVCVPTSPTPNPTAVFFPEPVTLQINHQLLMAVSEPPKMLPARVWGTVWVR